MSFLNSIPPAPLGGDTGPSCTLWHVGHALGFSGSPALLASYVQQLVDECGFPPPFPSRLKGRGITRAVTAHSTFRRDAVGAWLDDFLPPDCAAALDTAALAQAAADMDSAAASLGRLMLVQGGRA